MYMVSKPSASGSSMLILDILFHPYAYQGQLWRAFSANINILLGENWIPSIIVIHDVHIWFSNVLLPTTVESTAEMKVQVSLSYH